MRVTKTVQILPHMLAGSKYHPIVAVELHERALRADGWATETGYDHMSMEYRIYATKDVPDFAPHPTSEAY